MQDGSWLDAAAATCFATRSRFLCQSLVVAFVVVVENPSKSKNDATCVRLRLPAKRQALNEDRCGHWGGGGGEALFRWGCHCL